MSISATERTIEITLRHPDGGIRLAIPIDVPIAELMADVLDITGQPDGRRLGPEFRRRQPVSERQNTGRARGRRRRDALSSTNIPWSRCLPPRASRRERPTPRCSHHCDPRMANVRLSELTARTLPARLSCPARSWLAVRAAASASPHAEAPEPPAPGSGPANFTRATRVSPLERMREGWRSTGYEHRLDRLVLGRAAAAMREDRHRLAEGRGRKDDRHGATRLAAGVPAPRPGRRRRDESRLGLARAPAGARAPDLHRRPPQRSARRRAALSHAAGRAARPRPGRADGRARLPQTPSAPRRSTRPPTAHCSPG